MFCKQCGKEIDNNANFCVYCGNKLITEDNKEKIEQQIYAEMVKKCNNPKHGKMKTWKKILGGIFIIWVIAGVIGLIDGFITAQKKAEKLSQQNYEYLFKKLEQRNNFTDMTISNIEQKIDFYTPEYSSYSMSVHFFNSFLSENSINAADYHYLGRNKNKFGSNKLGMYTFDMFRIMYNDGKKEYYMIPVDNNMDIMPQVYRFVSGGEFVLVRDFRN